MKKSSISNLNPYLDEDSLLKVGGRIGRSSVTDECKRPIILPEEATFKIFKLYAFRILFD